MIMSTRVATTGSTGGILPGSRESSLRRRPRRPRTGRQRQGIRRRRRARNKLPASRHQQRISEGRHRARFLLADGGAHRWDLIQFRRVRREKHQPNAFGNIQARFAMPACIVENENDGSVKTRAGLSREGFQQRLEERLRDAIMHIPEGFACRGRHEGGYIEPVKAVMTKGDRPLADLRPDAPRYGLQAEPMLVACENFDGPIGVFFRFLDDGVRELFLNAASSSGVADFGFFGRGAWIDQPSAFSASQPSERHRRT